MTLGVDFMGKEWLDMMRSVGMIAVIRCHVWLSQPLDSCTKPIQMQRWLRHRQKQSQQAEDVVLI